MEKKIAELMAKYKCTCEEAISIIEEDEEIDGMTVGEINASYTKEEREAMKQNTKSSKGTKAKSDKPREKKIDADKVQLIKWLHDGGLFIRTIEGIENLSITNEQKEITFTFKGAEYSVTLTKHRPKKA